MNEPGQVLATSANGLSSPPASAEVEDAEAWGEVEVVAVGDGAAVPKVRWELKELKPLHRQVASLVAQGKRNVDIAPMCNITPEYVSMLIRQPLVKAYIAELCELPGGKLEALFEKTVDVIADAMQNGSRGEKLKAARLQLEATKRIGGHTPIALIPQGSDDRLEALARRLLELQSNVRKGRVFDENGAEVQDAKLYQPAV